MLVNIGIFCNRFINNIKKSVLLTSETEQKLREHLSKEDQERFIQYSNQLVSVNAVTVKESFLIGFRYGMLLMMEVLRDSPDLLGE